MFLRFLALSCIFPVINMGSGQMGGWDGIITSVVDAVYVLNHGGIPGKVLTYGLSLSFNVLVSSIFCHAFVSGDVRFLHVVQCSPVLP